MYLGITLNKNKKLSKTKLLKKQENIQKDITSDNQKIFFENYSHFATNVVKKSSDDYLVVYDFEEDE